VHSEGSLKRPLWERQRSLSGRCAYPPRGRQVGCGSLDSGCSRGARGRCDRAGKFLGWPFAEWEEGLVVAKGNPKGIRGFDDLQGAVRIINREVGSGSRALLDGGLAEAGLSGVVVAGYERIAPGHLSAAMAVARGDADCCMAPRIAANVFGLDFLPLLAERYELVIPEQRLDLPSVQALLDVLQRRSLRRELEALGGYDTAATGSEVCG
jgi:molybdate-binding protein